MVRTTFGSYCTYSISQGRGTKLIGRATKGVGAIGAGLSIYNTIDEFQEVQCSILASIGGIAYPPQGIAASILGLIQSGDNAYLEWDTNKIIDENNRRLIKEYLKLLINQAEKCQELSEQFHKCCD